MKENSLTIYAIAVLETAFLLHSTSIVSSQDNIKFHWPLTNLSNSDAGIADPFPFEDLASKEKNIVTVKPMAPPEILQGIVNPHTVTVLKNSAQEVYSEEEYDTSGSTEFVDYDDEDEDESYHHELSQMTTTPQTPIVEKPVQVTEITEAEPVAVTTTNIISSSAMEPPTTVETPTTIDPSVKAPPGEIKGNLSFSEPLPLKSSITPMDENFDEKLFLILQNSVRETFFAFRDILGTRYNTQIQSLENELKAKLNQLDMDLNVKVVALDTTTHSRIQTFIDSVTDQRKEDFELFSNNLHQLQKTHQMHIDAQKVEIQQLQAKMDLLTKAQSTLSTKMSQLQKSVNNLSSKVTEMVIKTSEDLGYLTDSQKMLSGIVDEIQLDMKTTDAEFRQMQEVVRELQKAANEDHGKLRRTMIRDQKQEPIQNCIRHLQRRNVRAALKHWQNVETIADDLKETLPLDIAKIIEETYGKNTVNLPTTLEFVHRAVTHGDRRLKETAYAAVLQGMKPSRRLNDQKKIIQTFNLAQAMKSDLGAYYNSSLVTSDIVSQLPDIIRLVTFEKVKLLLPTRGYLRVAADRKVTLVPQNGRFFDKDEILWEFEYDGDQADGTFYIKSDRLQKYLKTMQAGINPYGFMKQNLLVTGDKRDNGTKFQLTIVNHGEYVLLKSVFYNGYLSWKSNIQTIFGDDDSYFLILKDRKNGPSPYWTIEANNS